MLEQCQRIRDKVADARRRYEAGSIKRSRDADLHQFQLTPPLAEDELTAFENKIAVRLPEEFRAFLLHVGHGGAGPGMGISLWLIDYLLYRYYTPVEESPYAAVDHATLVKMRKDATDRAALKYIKQMQMSCLLYEGASENWAVETFGSSGDARFDSEDFELFTGVMMLVYYGGAQFDVLVLNGPYAGRVCWIDEQIEGDYSLPPVFAPEANFLDWYENWIDLVLTGADVNYGLRLAQASAAMEKNDG